MPLAELNAQFLVPNDEPTSQFRHPETVTNLPAFEGFLKAHIPEALEVLDAAGLNSEPKENPYLTKTVEVELLRQGAVMVGSGSLHQSHSFLELGGKWYIEVVDSLAPVKGKHKPGLLIANDEQILFGSPANHCKVVVRDVGNGFVNLLVIDAENYKNIRDHNEHAGIGVFKLGLFIGMPLDQLLASTLQATIHDSNKVPEIMSAKAEGAGADVRAYSEAAYATTVPVLQFLLGKELPLNVFEYLERAGKETGHRILDKWVKFDQKNQEYFDPSASLTDMLVHLVDNLTHTSIPIANEPSATSFVPFAVRWRLSNFPFRYGFLFNENEGVLRPDGTFMRYIDAQTFSTAFIARKVLELAQQNGRELPQWAWHDPETFIAFEVLNKPVRVGQFQF